MSKLITIMLASFVFCSCASQKNGKVYAYRQVVMGGARPVPVIDEKGRQTEATARESANFFIYLELPADSVQVKEIWVKQKPYAAKEVQVVSTPVVMQQQVKLLNADTLVRTTPNKVLQISLGLPVQAPTVPAGEQKKISTNEVVIRCVVKGRDRYYAGAIKNLPPVALQ
jgi:hypothetical protein